MNTPGFDLDRFERWLQEALLHRDGVEAAVASDAVCQQLPVTVANLEDQVVPGYGLLSGLQRLDIYSGMIRIRFQECLDEDFPALRQALGPEGFARLMRAYLEQCPSHFTSLADLGCQLATFLRETTAAVPDRDFLVDLAWLEWAKIEVFHEADEDPLEVAALDAIPTEAWVEQSFPTIAASRLHGFSYPVLDYLEAVRAGKKPPHPTSKASWVLVFRSPDGFVHRQALSAIQHRLLGALGAGETLGLALEACLELPGSSAESLLGGLSGWFQEWASAGIFRARAATRVTGSP